MCELAVKQNEFALKICQIKNWNYNCLLLYLLTSYY
jgi:hypothetical protein